MMAAVAKVERASSLVVTTAFGILSFVRCSSGTIEPHVTNSVSTLDPADRATTTKVLQLIPPMLRSRIRHGRRPDWMKPGNDAVAASSYTDVGQQWAPINLYPTSNRRNRAAICKILAPRAYPQGMTTDRLGTLYVTGAWGQHYGVATFGPNCGSKGKVFDDPYGIADDPVVDGGLLYLSTLANGGEPGSMEVYRLGGGSKPVRKFSDPSVVKGIGVAVDSHHNLFWSSTTDWWSGGEVVKFPNGKAPGIVLQSTKIGADFPGGVIVDSADNLLLVDQSANAIYVYAAPYNAPPFSLIALKGTAVYCTLTRNQKRIYCLDYQYGSVDAYSYPAGRYLYSYSNGIEADLDPVGIAIQPAVLTK